MKFLKDKLNRKGLLSLIGGAFLLFLGSTQFANAGVAGALSGLIGLSDVTSGFVTGISSLVSYLLAYIFGILIAIEAWFIGIILNINANILQTTLVQTGFSISLSIANLAFVLGIIVIALATILRSQTYGIKQLLWKLVVMAILVNFGLVIMSPIFAIGNSFTQYFLNCINPAAGGCNQNASGLSSFASFGTTMASAFNPANPFAAPTVASNSSLITTQQSDLNGALSASGASIGQAAKPVFGIIFVAVDLILIVIVLGGFCALLTVRYLYIAILAILLPFAWASWVFPSFSSHWKKWWELFIRWTFFAPVVLFFVYLALLTMKGAGSVFDISTYANPNNSAWAAISTFLTPVISPVITSFLQEILLAGLLIGGMMAANSMGIKMAGTMVSLAEKGGKAVRGAAWNATKRRTTDRLRSMGRKTSDDGKETTTTLQRLGSRLQNVPVPGFKAVGSKIAATGAPANFHEDRKEDIEKYVKGQLKVLDNKGLITRATSSTAFINPTEAAALGQELAKRDLLGKLNFDPADPTNPANKAKNDILVKKFLGVSEKMGNMQNILNNRPELATQTSLADPREITDSVTGLKRMETALEGMTRAITETTKKIKVADVLEINHKSMGDPTKPFPSEDQRNVAVNMSLQQLRKLGAEGSVEQTKAFKDTITKMFTLSHTPGTPPYPPDIQRTVDKLKDYVDDNPQWQYV